MGRTASRQNRIQAQGVIGEEVIDALPELWLQVCGFQQIGSSMISGNLPRLHPRGGGKM
jgi:hypothetical protein